MTFKNLLTILAFLLLASLPASGGDQRVLHADTLELDSGTHKSSVTAGSLSGDTTFTLPLSNGTSGYVLSTDGLGATSWAAGQAPLSIGTIGAAITNGLTLSGTTLSLGATDATHGGAVTTGAQTLGGGIKTFTAAVNAQAGVRLDSDNLTNYVALSAPTGMSGNTAIVFPLASGSTGQAMALDGSGVFTWYDPVSVTALNAKLATAVAKQPAFAASTANVTPLSGNPGSIDGIDFSSGGYLLLKNQSSNSENGLWLVNPAGAWTRTYDMPDDTTSTMGAVVGVAAGGTVNGSTLWFAQSSGSGSVPFVQIPTTSSSVPLTANRVVQTTTGGALTAAAAITASRALISDANGIPTQSATTSTELGFVGGVTSAIQTQLNAKEPTITTLTVAKGGTNSGTALNNNRVMQSAGGAVVEAAAITASRALVSDTNGIPTQSATTATELGYVSGVTSALQTQIDGKEPTITTLSVAKGGTNSGTALNNNRMMKSSGGAVVEAAAITASRALISDANGIATQSATTSTELGYVSGVSSALQTQLDGKLATSLLATKGDLVSFSTVAATLGVGSNGTVLTADSTATTGLKWGTSANVPATAGPVYSDGSALQSLAFSGNANKVLGVNNAATSAEMKTLAVGTTGSDFAVANAAGSITFNLPSAGTGARGAVTTAAQTFGGAKTFNDGVVFGNGATNLNWYEEGTWTPTVHFSGTNAASVTAVGRFTRIGNRVLINAYIFITKLTSTGNVTITNLPYAGLNVANYYQYLPVETFSGFTFPANRNGLASYILGTSTLNLIINSANGGANTAIDDTELAVGGAELVISGSYTI